MKHRKSTLSILVVVLTLMLVVTGCGDKNKESNGTASDSTNGSASNQNTTDTDSKLNVPDPNASHPIVTIEMDNGKQIKAELYPEVAPNTVNNFISLANKGFYDGTIFHRVIPGFMIQGGDPEGTGAGGPDYSIAGEFTSNGFQNDLKHTRGVLSMARTQFPDTAGSQFFIMTEDSPHLDGQYASFGKVTEGMEVVDEIVALDRDSSDRPTTPPVMKKVTVDTLGKEYPEPTTQK
ncbi:peptidylprolyl isomerase [Paenibacillus marinisediminis]